MLLIWPARYDASMTSTETSLDGPPMGIVVLTEDGVGTATTMVAAIVVSNWIAPMLLSLLFSDVPLFLCSGLGSFKFVSQHDQKDN
jgi:hypothetical protein